MEMQDLVGLGKASEKMLEVIQGAIGKIYTDSVGPHAEARRIKIIESAKYEAAANGLVQQTAAIKQAEDLLGRAGNRMLIQEVKRQGNIERVIELVKSELPDSVAVSPEPVNVDWATRFFEVVQDVSDDEVLKVWAKILAGEIVQPGTFSLRTIEVLRNLATVEAKIFRTFLELCFDKEYTIKINRTADFSEFGLSFTDLLHLRDSGLIQEHDNTQQSIESSDEKPVSFFLNGEKFLYQSSNPALQLPVMVLTRAGQELAKVTEVTLNVEYYKKVVTYLESVGCKREIL